MVKGTCVRISDAAYCHRRRVRSEGSCASLRHFAAVCTPSPGAEQDGRPERRGWHSRRGPESVEKRIDYENADDDEDENMNEDGEPK